MQPDLYHRHWPGPVPSGHPPLAFELQADYGLFSRVDVSPSVNSSYPAPTWSAAKGIIETIFWRAHVWEINPLGVELLSPVALTPYAFTYQGELRKRNHIAKNVNAMFRWQVLAQPRFRVVFDVTPGSKARPPDGSVGRFISRFAQRLQTGNHPTLAMGISDFLAVASFCSNAPVRNDEQRSIPLMLKTPHGPNGKNVYFVDVQIKEGRLIYPLGREFSPC